MRLLWAISLAMLVVTACASETDQLGDSEPATETTQEDTPSPAPTSLPPTTESDLDSLQFATSFGSCLGHCEDTVTFAGQSVFLTSLTNESPNGEIVNEGVIDPAAAALVADAARELKTAKLAERYGCPDCDDGGAASITLNRATHTYEFFNPPPAFVTLDGLVLSLREALRTCESNELIAVATGCTRTG